MTYHTVWTYMKKRQAGDLDIGSFMYSEFKGSPGNFTSFDAFELELVERANLMEKLPRNKQFPTTMTKPWELIAIAYGVGPNDYLANVLAFDRQSGGFVTWLANYDVGPRTHDLDECSVSLSNGHYFNYREAGNYRISLVERAKGSISPDDYACMSALLAESAERALTDFYARAARLVCVPEWVELLS